MISNRTPTSTILLTALVVGWAGASAGSSATLTGRVLDDGQDTPSGIDSVLVIAFDNSGNQPVELIRTTADAEGYYTLKSLPLGVALRVSYERPGYTPRPAWMTYMLIADPTSSDVPLLQEQADATYYVRVAHHIAAQISLEESWKRFEQFKLPASGQDQVRKAVIEIKGDAARRFFESRQLEPLMKLLLYESSFVPAVPAMPAWTLTSFPEPEKPPMPMDVSAPNTPPKITTTVSPNAQAAEPPPTTD